MMRRNGSMPKVVVCVIAFFGLVYFIYLYNDLSGQLKNTERSAERYRREQESVSAQLQVQYGHTERLQKALHKEKLKYKALLDDQIIAKDELKQRCDNDKEQMTNRLNSQQQQYKMLKSQHEDMEIEFGRLKNEKEKETEEHNKQDEERAIEYNQFKQEKSLEIASLKDSVANLEREREQLSQQVVDLKSQLQGTLTQVSQAKQTISMLQNQVQTQQNDANKAKETIVTLENQVKAQQRQLQTDQLTIQRNQGLLNYAQNLVQQAQAKQQQIEQQYQQLQQQQNIGGQQGANFQGIGQQQQQQMNLPARNQQNVNMQAGGVGMNQQQQPQGGLMGQGGFNQGQGGVQAIQQNNIPNNNNMLGNIIHGAGAGLNPNVVGQQGGNAENFNIADDIMKSLQDKHKPVDADLLEEHQKQHQIVPPGAGDKSNVRYDDTDRLGHQKHGQAMLGQDGHGIQQEQHQIGKPNLDNEPVDNHLGNKHADSNVHGGDSNHDNRIENQGPVNLQVQEPNLHGDGDKNKMFKDDELHFRPHIPVPDNQIQPVAPVDDSHRQEQLDIPLGKDNNQGGGGRNEHQLDAGGNADEDNDDGFYRH